ncbi:class I SAM-dependent methyltransferase [Aquicoccus sp. G2-2]|uniref:class I SAM-dependent methyltransferase n=1 Tax=Aquicoccus sp. G2-2 TaxID=3092120 RepID=UPI002ADF7AB8|nr:class I SAM-dependent methyltransferase [Aquicoccus sp. G2-2]MEA1114609.1 class I SAM-dependent methyltransferase [Aquicoccus sp. G2-2]
MSTIYETGDYLETNPDWHDEDGAWKAEQIVKMLQRHDLDLNTVADVGCGTGRVLQTLEPHLPDTAMLYGFDVAPAAIAIAQTHETPHLAFETADFLTGSSEVFDLVLLMDVFEHVPDYLGFLENLRLHGRNFMFHIPLDMNMLHVMMDHQTKSRALAGHLHYFSKSSALLTLEHAGYEIVDWVYTPVYKTAKARRSVLKRIIEGPRAIGGMLFPDFAVRLLGGSSVLALARPKLTH